MPDRTSPSGWYFRSCGAVSGFMRKLPCLGVVFAVIAAELPLILDPSMPSLAAAFFILPVVLLPLLFLPVRNVLFQFVLPAAAGFLSMLIHTADRPSSELRDLMLSSRICAEAEVMTEDPALSPGCGNVPGLPKLIRARVVRLKMTGETDWISLDSPVGLRWTGEPGAFSPGYGDRYRIRAVFEEPAHAVLPGGFDYADYLARTGIGVIARTKQAERVKEGSGLRRMFFDLREKILLRIMAPMRSDEAKSLASGILFGFAQGLSGQTKRDFIRSGTIHILTVSGTHVALFSALMMLIFAPVPFRARACIVIALAFCYAWMTGLREPSFRAFLMLAFFLGARVFLLRTSALNTLALAAAVLLIANPWNLTSQGFQFSFLTVAALILASPGAAALFRALTADRMLIPAKYVLKRTWFILGAERRIFQGAAASLTAFASGVGLTARYQGIFVGAAVAVNMLLLPIVWLCFLFAALALVFGAFFARILESLLLLIPYLCGLFAETGGLDFAVPPLWSVFVYLILFFLLLIPTEGRLLTWKAGLFGFLCLIPVWWHFRSASLPPEIAVISGRAEENRVTLVLADPVRKCGTVINLPDFETAKTATDFLRSRGITDLRYFVPEDARKSTRDGLRFLLPEQEPMDSFHMPRKNSALSAEFSGNDLTIQRSGDNFHAVFSDRGRRLLSADLFRLENGGVRVILTTAGDSTPADMICMPSLNRNFVRFELKETQR